MQRSYRSHPPSARPVKPAGGDGFHTDQGGGLSSRRAKPAPQPVIGKQPGECAPERSDIALRNQKAGHAVLNDFRRTIGAVEGDNRAPVRHRLDQHIAEALITQTQHKAPRGAIPRGGVGHPTGQMHAISNAERTGLMLQVCPFRALAKDGQVQVFAAKAVKDGKQQVKPLLRDKASDAKDKGCRRQICNFRGIYPPPLALGL